METNPYQTPVAGPQPPAFAPPSLSSQLGLKQILFSFQGRIPRRTFWLWRILTMVVFMVLFSLTIPLATMGGGRTAGESASNPVFPILMVLLLIALFVPLVWISLALVVKRWHDRGKSGVYVFIGFIPLVGPVWTFIECGCLRGTFGHNLYGSDPT